MSNFKKSVASFHLFMHPLISLSNVLLFFFSFDCSEFISLLLNTFLNLLKIQDLFRIYLKLYKKSNLIFQNFHF